MHFDANFEAISHAFFWVNRAKHSIKQYFLCIVVSPCFNRSSNRRRHFRSHFKSPFGSMLGGVTRADLSAFWGVWRDPLEMAFTCVFSSVSLEKLDPRRMRFELGFWDRFGVGFGGQC